MILKLLVSGGVGYIGTHSIIKILNAEHDISQIDDLSKSHIAAVPRVKQPTKRNLAFIQADLCVTTSLRTTVRWPVAVVCSVNCASSSSTVDWINCRTPSRSKSVNGSVIPSRPEGRMMSLFGMVMCTLWLVILPQ
ncbi:MAG TPA: hypothetical protein DEA94_07505 [Rhodobacteraceae bacterium]|nr:hypothetical protein [Paracoccaceae bacterium]